MAPAPYEGQHFRLKKHCVLIHVCEPDQPDPLSVPMQIINMAVTPHQCLELSETAAFIMRFLLQRVDTKLIRELLQSEFQGITSDALADAQITEFVEHYMNTTINEEKVLEAIPATERSAQKALGQIKPKKRGKFKKPLKLDFSVGSVGWTVFKLPLR